MVRRDVEKRDYITFNWQGNAGNAYGSWRFTSYALVQISTVALCGSVGNELSPSQS